MTRRRAWPTAGGALELKESQEGFPVGVRAVLELLRMRGRPMTVPRMGRTLALSRQFVRRMVNEAAGRDLVEAIPNPAHQRSSLFRLTDTGRVTIETLLARESVLPERASGDLTEADVDACVRELTRMLELFEDVDVNRGSAPPPAPAVALPPGTTARGRNRPSR
ncbi:MarR family transcriptional regulator [Streptomyces sp. TG1A-60]|uniref:MarR family transcriptional regulator n=1 Tax=Streptomyces sp. TG1A-60 TaxID=3129111 RepID=UPI0030CE9238